MSDGSDSGSDSSSDSGSSYGSSGYGPGYSAAYSAYTQAQQNSNSGPTISSGDGSPMATETTDPRIAQLWATQHAGAIGGVLGALSPIPLGGLIGKQIGNYISNNASDTEGRAGSGITNIGDTYYAVPQQQLSGSSSTGSGGQAGYNAQAGLAGGAMSAYGAVSGGLAGGSTAGMSVAEQQAMYDAQAARLTTQLNRPNQSTPYGSQTWTQTPGTDQWSSNISLTPEQQMLLNVQNATAAQRAKLSEGMLTNLSTQGGPQYQTNAGLTTNPGLYTGTVLNTRAGLNTNAGLNTDAGLKTDLQLQGSAGLGLQQIGSTNTLGAAANAGAGSIDLTNLTDLPEVSDATRQRVEDALYQRSQSRLDPQWQQRQDALNSQLANQGITLGSGAFDTSVGQFGRDRNDAYQTALNEAIVGGGTEQSRLFDLALKPRQQEFAERSKAADVSVANAGYQTQASVASAANANAAAIANANRELEAARMNNQFKLDAGNFNNSSLLNSALFNNSALLNNANFGNSALLNNAAFGNSALLSEANFGNSALLNNANFANEAMLNNANFSNTAKLNNMNANNGAQTQILNALASLQQGSGPTLPTFASGASGANVNPVNYAQIANNDQLAQTAKDNAQTQSNNATIGALGGLAGSLFNASSDSIGGSWLSSLFG